MANSIRLVMDQLIDVAPLTVKIDGGGRAHSLFRHLLSQTSVKYKAYTPGLLAEAGGACH
jgi:hypothetical protein